MPPLPPERLLQSLLDSQPDLVVFALDTHYRYLAFNALHARTMRALWEVDIQLGASMLDCIQRDDDRERARANFDRALRGEAFVLTEAYGDPDTGRRRAYRNTYAPLRDGEQVVGLTVFLADVTEQRRVELELASLHRDLEERAARRTAEMLHAQKLESLGVLAGGIAHDFNNILAAILGSVDVAVARLHDPDGLQIELERIRRGAERAAERTNQMLSYAGRAERRPVRVRLPHLVQGILELLGSSLRGRARLVVDLSPDTPALMADASQLEQVIMNLLTNAADAVGDRGTVTVRTRGLEAREGWFAQLEVSDDGVGMDEHTRSRIFDPFFTTKFKGRGLGLAAVQGIIASHGGVLDVHSRPGQGSRFVVRLPAIEPETDHPEPEPDPGAPHPLPAHVLVVDDEAEVRRVCALLLRASGMCVSEAADGEQAIDAVQRDPSIDMVLLDLTMPGPTPEQTLDALNNLRPELPVVVFSGFDEHEVRSRLGARLRGFVPKPFRHHALLDALSAALGPPR